MKRIVLAGGSGHCKVIIETLKELRKKSKYSVSDLANALGYKTPTGYWLIEQGQRKVSIDALYRLSVIYDCTMEDLIKANPLCDD